MACGIFIPFFSGVCLDPRIETSSRIFQYIFRIFAEGDVALPAEGMGAIPAQLAAKLPEGSIRTSTRAESIHQGKVVLTSGETISGQAVVLATEGPETMISQIFLATDISIFVGDIRSSGIISMHEISCLL
jgi:phytoene dehydrogenase-like protein